MRCHIATFPCVEDRYTSVVGTPEDHFSYLYHGHGEHPSGVTVPEHSHPFWQCEFTARGRVAIMAGGMPFELPPGEVLLIPPDVAHNLEYVARRNEYRSIKFTGPPADEARFVPASTLSAALIRCLGLAMGDYESVAPQNQAVVEHCLGGLVALTYSAEELSTIQADPRLAQIERYIDSHLERQVEVAEVARKLGCTARTLGRLIQAKYACSLKHFIDRRRCDHIGRALRYGDETIGALAERFGFTDQFTFSRYFKRVMGKSPSTWRRKLWDAA